MRGSSLAWMYIYIYYIYTVRYIYYIYIYIYLVKTWLLIKQKRTYTYPLGYANDKFWIDNFSYQSIYSNRNEVNTNMSLHYMKKPF